MADGGSKKEEEWLSDFGDSEADSLNTGIAMVTPIQNWPSTSSTRRIS